MSDTVLAFALILLVPGLLALVIGICNDLGRERRKRDETYHSEPDRIFYTVSFPLSGTGHEKNYYINKRNHRHDEKIKRHKSMR